MSSKKAASTSRVLREVANHLDILGEEHTLNLILKDRKQNLSVVYIDKVIEIVCTHLSISAEKLYQKGRHDIKKNLSLRLISYYCCEKLSKHGVTHMSVSVKLKKTRSLITRYCAEMIQKRKDDSAENKWVLKYCKELDLLIAGYIKTIKSKTK